MSLSSMDSEYYGMSHARSLYDLPVEMQCEILGNLTIDDLVSVSLVSKLLHSLCTSFIYRELDFDSYYSDTIWKCFDTITRNTEAAHAVRSVSIVLTNPNFENIFRDRLLNPPILPTPNQAIIFRTGLCSISSGLTCLILRGLPQEFSYFLPSDVSFPALKELFCADISPNTLSLIRNCPKLEILRIWGRIEFIPTEIHLPHLTELQAPNGVICAITSGSALKCVDIIGNSHRQTNQQEAHDSILALLSRTGHALEHFGVHNVKLDSDTLDLISTSFPGVESLRFTIPYSLSTFYCPTDMTDGIRAMLPAFAKLRKISFACNDSGEDRSLEHITSKWDFELLSEWSYFSNSLKKCKMPSTTLWLRSDDGPWVPVSNTKECAPWCQAKIEETKAYESIIKYVRDNLDDDSDSEYHIYYDTDEDYYHDDDDGSNDTD